MVNCLTNSFVSGNFTVSGQTILNGPIKLNQIKKGIKSLKISFLKFMKDPFKIINFMEKVFTLGQMDEIIMENGFKEKWVEKEPLLGKMVEFIVDFISKIWSTVKGNYHGQMEEF